MASNSVMSFEDSFVEFEDMEMTEFDADTLMKLLEEDPAAGGEKQEGGGGVIQPPESDDGGSGNKKEEEVLGNELEWVVDVAEMSPAPPCAVEVGGEILDVGEYGLDYYHYYYQWYNNNNYYNYNYNNNNNDNNSAVLVEEMAFEEGLWQNCF